MWWIIFFVLVIVLAGILGSKHDSKKQKGRAMNLNNKLANNKDFNISQKIEGVKNFYLFAVDDYGEKIMYSNEFSTTIISFKDIIGVEIIEDGTIISQKSALRTVGGVIVGGIIAGGVGSVIGGLSGASKQKNKVSHVTVKILLRNSNSPSLSIKCFDSNTMTTEKGGIETEGKMESYIYKTGKQHAEQIKDLISIAIDKIDRKDNSEIIEVEPQEKISRAPSSPLDNSIIDLLKNGETINATKHYINNKIPKPSMNEAYTHIMNLAKENNITIKK